MRELIATIGLAGLRRLGEKQTAIHWKKDSIQLQRHYADIFFNMCQYPEKGWTFEDAHVEEKHKNRFRALLPFWELLAQVEKDNLHRVSKSIVSLRNGFDHAWLGRKGVPQDVDEKCKKHFSELQQIITGLIEKHMIQTTNQ